MKIIKWLLPSLLFAPALISCNMQVVQKEENVVEQKWNAFLQREYVNTILNLVFEDNKEAREKYIESQKQIPNDYIKSVNNALLFAANPIKSLTPTSIFGKKVHALKRSISEFDKLTKGSYDSEEKVYNGNWLWLLFNIDKVIYSSYPDYDKFIAPADATTADYIAHTKTLGSFYKLGSNDMAQFVVAEDDEETKLVYLLTKEGFITRLRLTRYEENEPWAASVFTYAWTYKELYNSENLNDKFDLKAYVAITNEFENKHVDRTFQTLFEEQYGGNKINYTIFRMEE